MQFHVGQQVIYRVSVAQREKETWVRAVVRTVTESRVTVEFEVRGERVLRIVKPDRLDLVP